MPILTKKHIGKKVAWRKFSEKGLGVLLEIDPKDPNLPYRVRTSDEDRTRWVGSAELVDEALSDELICRIARNFSPPPLVNTCLYDQLYSGTKPTTMTNASPIEYFKKRDLTKDDRLLLEYGMEQPTGEPTPAGYDLSDEIDYKRNRAEIIKILKEMDAEKKAEAKKK